MAKKVEFELILDASGAVKSIKTVDGELVDVDKSLRKATDSTEGFGNEMKSASASGIAFGNVIANYASRAIDGLINGIQDSINVGAQYQSNLAELSAITGIAGNDLQNLGQTAREQAIITGVASSDQIEAFKLLASNIDVSVIGGVEGLKLLGQETVKLTQASGVDLATASNTVASSINQFGLSANEASRVVNVLAAGSKFGAAEVGDLGESLKNAGTTASLSGLSFETTVGALEVLSQNALKGAEAGTGLRNVLSILQSGSSELAELGITPATLKTEGLSKTLEMLKPILNDNAALTKIFGRESANVGAILIKNSGFVDEMTGRITGTSTALEQASKNTATYENSVARLGAAIENRQIDVFESLQPLLMSTANFITDLIAPSVSLADTYKEQQTKLNVLVGTLQTANLSESDRLRVIKDIQTNYPDFLGNIDAEKVSNEDLAEALKKTNNEYIAKIALQRQDEKIQEASRKQAELLEKRFQAQSEVMALITKAQSDYGIQIDANADFSQKYAQAQEGLKKQTESARATFKAAGIDLKGIGSALPEDIKLLNELETAFAKTDGIVGFSGQIEKQTTLIDELNKEKENLKKSLIENGFLYNEETIATENNTKAKEKNAEAEAKLAEEKKKASKQNYDILLAEIAEIEALQAAKERDRLADIGAAQAKEERRDQETQNEIDRLINEGVASANLTLQKVEDSAIEGQLIADKEKAAQRLLEQQIASVNYSIKSGKDALNEVKNLARQTIQAYLAQAVAGAIKSVFGTIPFPFSLAVAGGAGIAVNLAFNQLLPKFEKGGVIGGELHSNGGTLIEAEKGEFIVNRESTSLAMPLIEAINESPSKAAQINQIFMQAGYAENGGFVFNPVSMMRETTSNEIVPVLSALTKKLDKIGINFDWRQFNENQRGYNDMQLSVGLME